MESVRVPEGALKFVLGWLAVFLFRLLPFRAPNVEPMLAVVMPFSKRYNGLASFAFGFFGIVLFDAVTSGWGAWTWVTALCYGALGVGAHVYFKAKPATTWNFVKVSVVGTLFYDAVTALIGPVFDGQSLVQAYIGQIPFTLLHLTGAIMFAAVLSPAIYYWVAENEAVEYAPAPVVVQS